jgi:hypothetical protein
MTPDELTAVTTRSDDNHRLHSALGYQPPASYAAATPTKPTLTRPVHGVPSGTAVPGDLAVWDGHLAMIVNGIMVEAGNL